MSLRNISAHDDDTTKKEIVDQTCGSDFQKRLVFCFSAYGL